MNAPHRLLVPPADALTVIRDPQHPLGKRFVLNADGRIEKHPQVAPSFLYAKMLHVPDTAALADLLRKVGEDEHLAIINSRFLGVEVGERFIILSEAEIGRRYGLEGREQTAGVHQVEDDAEGATKALGRLKENVLPSAWQILDRDTDEHTPAPLAAMGYDAWIDQVEKLLPGVAECDRLRAFSSSSRVLLDGKPVGGGNGHTWVRMQNADDVERLRGLLPFRAMDAGLSWQKPRHSRSTGEVVGHSPSTILDPSVWSRGRVIFVGKPVVEGKGLTVCAQHVETHEGLLGPELPTDTLKLPPPERLREITAAAGMDIQIRPTASGLAVDSYDLALSTEIEIHGRGVMTVSEAAEILPAGGKLRCQAPFRASDSWAGVLGRGADGKVFVFDSGTHTTHWLNNADATASDFDALPSPSLEEAAESEAARQRNAEKASSQTYAGGRFKHAAGGVFFIGTDKDGEELPPLWLCPRLDVLAMTRDAKSGEWGRLLGWQDADGVAHRWAMPMDLLQGDGSDVRRELARLGLNIAPGKRARELLMAYLQVWPVQARARCVDRLGWHGGVFVTPAESIGQAGELVVFQNAHAIEPAFSEAGTAAAWRDSVAALSAGNSRLVFAICAALAGPLAELACEDSGGFHLRGASSSGKTTALKVAASVWGDPSAYPRLWRATANGLEGLAALHNDGLLILDELSQIDPREAGEAAYLLANGQGKARASRTGTARQSARWRVLFLSAGEESLTALMARAGRKANAGQEIRLADIEADAGAGMGAFEALHDQATPAALALAVKDAAARCHGAVGVTWLRSIVRDRAELAGTLPGVLRQFVADAVPAEAAGQVERVARRFALLAAAGELATGYGLTGWPVGEASRGVRACFDAWLAGFGGSGNREERTMLAQVRAFFEAHGASRFQPWDDLDSINYEPRTLNRAGFVRVREDGARDFYVLPEAYRREVCTGFDEKAVTRALLAAGWLVQAKDRRFTHKARLPGMGSTRCYLFGPAMWSDDNDLTKE
jgi:uncharacterized protein (DUF927 family)